jgi:hypothetical protein
MSQAPNQENATQNLYAVPPAQNHSTIIKFTSEAAKGEPAKVDTSVEIFCDNGRWYCQVCRGGVKTRPMGPYTKHQAEQIQDARRKLIAKMGSARLIFEAIRKG